MLQERFCALPNHDFNKVTFEFTFPPDKWVGLDSFKEDVALLERLATALGFDSTGRRRLTVTKEQVGDDEITSA
jgi:hypothetical protein